jgi:hypothetical protein
MNRKKHLIFISLALIAAMLGAMLSPTTVRADDAPPPPPESEPTPPPEAPPTEETSPPGIPTEETSAEPAPESSPAEILDSLPEGVSLVVLDESGEALPLASQETLQILAAPDPSFTVGGVTYNFTAADCDPFTAGLQPCSNPIQAAVDALSSNNWSPDDDTIYVESGTFTENVTINGTAWTTVPITLIIQGAGSGSTILDGWMNVSNLNQFTLRGFTVTDANSSGNDVYLVFNNLQGELLLDDVKVDRNPLVVSSQPGILITDQSDDVFVYNVSSTGSYNAGMAVETIAPDLLVNIYDSIFSHNGRFGLDITSAGGMVSLEDVYADRNGWDGVHIYGSAPTYVSVSGSSFFFNGEAGLYVQSNGGDIEVETSVSQFNGEDGFFLDTYNVSDSGNITLALAAATNNGYSGLDAYGNDVTLDFVFMLQNVEAGALVVAENAFTVSNSYFGNNGLDGLYAEAGSDIQITNSEFDSNAGHGAYLSANGDVHLECSDLQDNGGYGALVDTANTFVLDSFFSGNASGDYLFTGGGTLTKPYVCVPAPPSGGPGGKTGSGTPGLPVRVVNVADGNGVELECDAYSATLLVLPGGDSVLFPCPLQGTGVVSRPENLPAAAPESARMVSVLEADLRRGGTLLQIVDGALTVKFVVPEGVDPAALAILWWDGSQWVELSAAATDGRAVFNSGALNAEGMFEASLNFTGVFMLVER